MVISTSPEDRVWLLGHSGRAELEAKFVCRDRIRATTVRKALQNDARIYALLLVL